MALIFPSRLDLFHAAVSLCFQPQLLIDVSRIGYCPMSISIDVVILPALIRQSRLLGWRNRGPLKDGDHLPLIVQVHDDIGPADEFSVYEELRDRRPVGML